MALKEARVKDEAELESLLVRDPNQIEEGFKVITHQRKTRGRNRLDILGVDSQGVLTIAELKVTVDVNQLRQALCYYDWILERGLDWIIDAYKQKLKGVEIKQRMPQIFLVGPDFDEMMIRETKYIRSDIQIRLFRYLAFEVNEKKEIKLMETPVPEIQEVETKPWSIHDNIDYISEKRVRDVFRDTMGKIRSIDEGQIEEKAGNWVISYWTSGRKFCEIYPKKKWFAIGFKTDENEQKWDCITNMTKTEEMEDIFQDKIVKAYKLMKRG
ncbi:MAG: endonuclease NucS domain-containing protein [Planctomycetota bacterium]|jgi:hypothetical protein